MIYHFQSPAVPTKQFQLQEKNSSCEESHQVFVTSFVPIPGPSLGPAMIHRSLLRQEYFLILSLTKHCINKNMKLWHLKFIHT